MRTDIPQAILDALNTGDHAALQVRIHGGKSRIFIEALNTDHAFAEADGPGVQAEPLPQATAVVNSVVATIVNAAGTLEMATSFQSPLRPTSGGSPLVVSSGMRPGLAADGSRLYVFYALGNQVRRAVVDADQLALGIAECVLDDQAIYINELPVGAIHALSATEIVLLYIDEGGVRGGYVKSTDLTWTGSRWGRRFMFPDKVMLAGDLAWLNHSAAVKFGSSVFVYLAAPNGSVRAVEYDTISGIWGITFEALPAMLSQFIPVNAIVVNGRIAMTLQFERLDPTGGFTSTMTICLLTTSHDGRNFRLDRTVAIAGGDRSDPTTLGLRYFVSFLDAPDERYGVDASALVLSDANRWAAFRAPFDFTDLARDYTIEDCFPVEVQYGAPFELYVPCTLDNLALIEYGDVIDIEFGVRTGDGLEYFQAARCLLIGINASMGDAEERIALTLITLSAGRLMEMSHPFTFAVQGREYIYDPMDNMDNFEAAADEGYVLVPFMIDFWDGGEKIAPQTHNAFDMAEVVTKDLDRMIDLVDFPEITQLPFNIELYGWSRSGKPTPNEGGTTADRPSNLNAPNDKLGCKLYLIRDGEDQDIEVTVWNVASGYDHFPQTWYKIEAGSYPVVLQAEESDGIQVGDRIRKIAMLFSNTRTPDTAETVYYPERIEIPDIMMKVTSFKETWEEVEVNLDFQTEWDFTDGNDGWYWEEANEFGDPIVSWEWNYVIGCRVDIEPVHCIQIDLSYPGGGPNNYADGCGNVGPSNYASGAGKFSYEFPVDVLATTSSRMSAVVDLIYKRSPTGGAENGAAWLSVRFSDGTYYSIEADRRSNGQSAYNLTVSIDIPTEHAGKTVSKLCIAGAGRGYFVRFHSVKIENFATPEPEPITHGLDLLRTGIPVVFFAQKPFFALNGQVEALYQVVGDHSWGGVVCCATDGINYIAARASSAAVELIKVRAGAMTVLASAAKTFPTKAGAVHLKFLDGVFQVFIQDYNTRDYGLPLLTYEWKEADGLLLTDPEISHVGIYALRDAPYARICGYDGEMSSDLGILPGCHLWDQFPDTGTVRIEDSVYTYSGKGNAVQIMGPYQGRNVGGPYSYQNNGAAYRGNATEFTRFEWLDNAQHHNDFDGQFLATDTGVVWEISDVDFRPFITTDGQPVYLKNRGRFFGPEVSGNVIGMNVQVWIANVLRNLVKISGEAGVTHEKGTLLYLINDSRVVILSFSAASGIRDLSDRDAIDAICKVAGAQARFPGDYALSEKQISGSWKVGG